MRKEPLSVPGKLYQHTGQLLLSVSVADSEDSEQTGHKPKLI